MCKSPTLIWRVLETPSALISYASAIRSYCAGRTRMRNLEEDEGLIFQIRLGKAVNAKLRTTDFIMQSK